VRYLFNSRPNASCSSPRTAVAALRTRSTTELPAIVGATTGEEGLGPRLLTGEGVRARLKISGLADAAPSDPSLTTTKLRRSVAAQWCSNSFFHEPGEIETRFFLPTHFVTVLNPLYLFIRAFHYYR
jgi:hypothetical protein